MLTDKQGLIQKGLMTSIDSEYSTQYFSENIPVRYATRMTIGSPNFSERKLQSSCLRIYVFDAS